MFEIIAVTYGHNEKIKCFINSIKSQSFKDWFLHVVHDGECDQFRQLKRELEEDGYINDERIKLSALKQRANDYGHSLRDWALKNPISDSLYTVITNGDNYYVPEWLLYVNRAAQEKKCPEIMYWDCVHNHQNHNFDRPIPYGLLSSEFREGAIDMGCAAIKSEIARQVGFNSRAFNADWLYFDECRRYMENPRIEVVPQILFVHN